VSTNYCARETDKRWISL